MKVGDVVKANETYAARSPGCDCIDVPMTITKIRDREYWPIETNFGGGYVFSEDELDIVEV